MSLPERPMAGGNPIRLKVPLRKPPALSLWMTARRSPCTHASAPGRGWLAKVYEIDPLVCHRTHARAVRAANDQRKCGWEMRVIAVIQDPVEIQDILAHLVKAGRAPPGFDPALLN